MHLAYLFDHGMWLNHRKRRGDPSGLKGCHFFKLSLKPPAEVFQADEVACQMRCPQKNVAQMEIPQWNNGLHGCQDILSRSQLLYVDPHPARSNLSDTTNMVLQSWVNMKIDVYIIHTLYIFTHVAAKDNYSSCLTTLIMYLHFFRYFHSCLVACC